MAHRNEPLEITPQQAAALRKDAGPDDAPLLLDCRTPREHDLARLDGSALIPMNELPQRIHELHPHRHRPIIVYCHAGVRSLAVAQFLRQNGYSQAQSLAGGIDRWSREIDPSIPRY